MLNDVKNIVILFKIYWLSKYKLIVLILFLAVANLLLYWPASLYFLNDDFVHIPLTDYGVLFQQRSIRPIHELLVKFDLLLWQKNATGYHVTALLLHFIVALQLYFLTKTIQTNYFTAQASSAKKTALLAVVLFLLYPQHAESLAWVLGRTPTLSAIFLLALIQLFLQVNYKPTTYILAFLLFALTLLTYEQSILFPIIFLLVANYQKTKKNQIHQYYFSVVTIAVALLYIIARKLVTTEIVGVYEGANFNVAHLKQLFANTLSLLYRLFLNPISTTQTFLMVAGLFTLLSVTLVWYHKSKLLQKPFLLFIIVTCILLVPIVSLGITIRSFESGRYLYLPSIFLALALAIYIQQKQITPIKLGAFLIVIAIYWGFGKVQSSRHFFEASNYAKSVQQNVSHHFSQSINDTLYIDTLRLTVNRLPVYRMGFKSGIHWLNPLIDSNKIKVGYYYDEFLVHP